MAESVISESASNGHGTTESEMSALEQKIFKQIEYYFGDKNIQRDKFLRQKTEEDDGWVSFECLATFNRLKALSPDIDVHISAMKKASSELVELSDDSKKIRRLKSVPIPELTPNARQISKAKTIYCKGFPQDVTLDEVEEYFQLKGKVIYIMMRRKLGTKEFKGSVFVEFSTLDEAKAFIAEEGSKFKEEELIKKYREDYYKEKNDERAIQKEEERKKKQEERAKKEKEREGEGEEELAYEKGSVLHFKDVGEQTSREDLKELFGPHEEIAWVDFAREDIDGFIRFTKAGGAQRAIDAIKKANDDKVMIRNSESTVRVLEGDEEREYFKKVKEERAKKRQRKDKRGGRDFGARGRGRGRGGRGGRGGFSGGKRKGDSDDVKQEVKGAHAHFDDGPPPAKQVKTEGEQVKTEDKQVKTED